jgi:hypothetical protein
MGLRRLKTKLMAKRRLAMTRIAENGSVSYPQPALSLRAEPAERSNLIIKFGIASLKNQAYGKKTPRNGKDC